MIAILIYGIIAALVGLKGLFESTKKGNSFGLTPYLFWMGIFVWGDATIIGFFWFFSALISYLLKDYLLFLLIISVFWLVRSIGETIYWINEQFSVITRNPPETLKGYKFFKNDSIWFIYQIFWQAISVISIITTIYLSSLWPKSKF